MRSLPTIPADRVAERGFTIVEAVVAVAVLAIGLLGVVAALATTIRASGISTDTHLAATAIRNKVNDIQAGTGNFYTTWNNHTFTVAGLRSPPSGAQGQVTLLTEAEAQTFFGSSVYLDGDATPNETTAPAAGWKLYAVRVRVNWGDRTQNVTRTMDVTTVVVNGGT